MGKFVRGVLDVAAPLVRSVAMEIGGHAFADRYVFLFFSAGWCPPHSSLLCKIATWYAESIASNRAVSVVYVSSDETREEFEKATADMPPSWLGFWQPSSRLRRSAAEECQVSSIPAFVLIDSDWDRNVVMFDATHLLLNPSLWPPPPAPSRASLAPVLSKCGLLPDDPRLHTFSLAHLTRYVTLLFSELPLNTAAAQAAAAAAHASLKTQNAVVQACVVDIGAAVDNDDLSETAPQLSSLSVEVGSEVVECRVARPCKAHLAQLIGELRIATTPTLAVVAQPPIPTPCAVERESSSEDGALTLRGTNTLPLVIVSRDATDLALRDPDARSFPWRPTYSHFIGGVPPAKLLRGVAVVLVVDCVRDCARRAQLLSDFEAAAAHDAVSGLFDADGEASDSDEGPPQPQFLYLDVVGAVPWVRRLLKLPHGRAVAFTVAADDVGRPCFFSTPECHGLQLEEPADDARFGWGCDDCQRIASEVGVDSEDVSTKGNARWYCGKCNIDLCDGCVTKLREGARASGMCEPSLFVVDFPREGSIQYDGDVEFLLKRPADISSYVRRMCGQDVGEGGLQPIST